MKNLLKVLILVLAMLFLVACSGDETQQSDQIQDETTNAAVSEDSTVYVEQETEQTTETTTESTTITTTATTELVTEIVTEIATQEATTLFIPSTVEEVAATYNQVINALKQEQNLTITKSDDVVFEITDCSVPAVKTIMNTFIQGFLNSDEISYDFTNGTTSDGTTVNSIIYPSEREACVTASDLAIGTATATADGGYCLYLQIKEEYITSDGTNISEPPSHYTALDIVMNLPPLDEAPVEISSVEAFFAGAIIEVEVGADGKVQSIRAYQPLEGTGFGEITVFTVEVTMGGSVDSYFTITYK